METKVRVIYPGFLDKAIEKIDYNLLIPELNEVYQLLGEYRSSINDEAIFNGFQEKIIYKIYKSILSKRSTQSTQSIENNDFTIDEIEGMENDIGLTNNSSEKTITKRIYSKYNIQIIPNNFDVDFYKNLHKELYKDFKVYRAGKFKIANNKVGDKVFVDFDKVKQNIESLNNFLNATNISDPLIKASLMHGFFIGIHPFTDGNGRIGRLILDKYISKELETPLYISESINKSGKEEYYAALDSFHSGHDINVLILFILSVIKRQLILNKSLLQQLLSDVDKYKKIFEFNNVSMKNIYWDKIFFLLASREIISQYDISITLETTRQTSATILKNLMELQIIDSKKISVGRFTYYRINKKLN